MTFMCVFYGIFISVLEIWSVYVTKLMLEMLAVAKTEPIDFEWLIIYMVVIVGISIFVPMVRNYATVELLRGSNRIQLALYGLVLAKATRYNTVNSSVHPSGRILNYIQVDVPKFEQFFPTLFWTTSSGFGLVFYYGYMIILIGNTSIIVISTLVVVAVLLSLIYKIRLSLRSKLLEAKDVRLDFFKNVIKNLKYIKMRAWENFYYYRIYELREKELYMFKLIVVAMGFIFYFNWLGPSIPIFLVILSQAYFGENLYTFATFSAFLKVCYSLNEVMLTLPWSISTLFDIYISGKRVEEFLNAEEIDQSWIQTTRPLD